MEDSLRRARLGLTSHQARFSDESACPCGTTGMYMTTWREGLQVGNKRTRRKEMSGTDSNQLVSMKKSKAMDQQDNTSDVKIPGQPKALEK